MEPLKVNCACFARFLCNHRVYCSRSGCTTNLLAQFERFRILGQPMRCPQSCALALSAFLVGQIVQGAEQPADIVVLNGKIVTVNPQSSMVEAAAVREGRFVAVGANSKVKKLVGDRTRVSFDEKRKGSIEVGKLGDLVLLSDDLLPC